MGADDNNLEQLRRSAEYLDLLLNFSTDLIMIADRDGKPLAFSQSYADLVKEALGIEMRPGLQPHKHLADPKALAYWDDLYRRVLSGETFRAEYSHVFGPDDTRHFSVAFRPMLAGGEVLGFSEMTRDITRRRNVEEALRASEALFRTAIESIPFDLFAVGKDGRYIIQNTHSRDQWGDIVGKRPREVADNPETLASWEENNRRAFAGEVVRGEVEIHLHGEFRQFYNVIAPISNEDVIDGILGINVDITERKRIEHELQRKDRLDSLGLLAGGIAHDFNNLLSGVFGNIEMARQHVNLPEEVMHRLDDALSSLAASRDLTRQLLTFAKGGSPVKRVVQLSSIVEEAAHLALSGSRIELESQFPTEDLCVNGDPGQLRQVFSNVFINARQAMPDGGGIRIEIGRVSRLAGARPGLPEGEYVRVRIIDQGTGIAPGLLTRVFDPFFTTKPEGSGLGLSMAYSIVNKHEGDITIESGPEGGTSVTILLPLADGPEAADCHHAVELKRGSGRALLMDDEPNVLKVLALMVAKLGYEVDQTTNGDEALALYRRTLDAGGRYEFVILDLTVTGGMGGEETLLRLVELDSSVTAIATSGYSVGSVFTDPEKHGFAAALAKPFQLKDLGRAISGALSR